MKRQADGSFVRIDTETALDEVAERLRVIIDRDGPDAIALYQGAGTFLTATMLMMMPVFRGALGTQSYFSSATIDQSSKFVVVERLGVWTAGKHALTDSDVVLLVGTNPLVAHATAGCLVVDPVKTLKAAKARGLKLIVIDPRRSETAVFADIFLQPFPGEDPTVVAGLLRHILSSGWVDRDFTERFVEPGGMNRLAEMVAPFTPEYVAARAGIPADDLRNAAEMFATSGVGSAFSGTGPSMAPHPNLAEHLIELLNVVCGRYRRAGDQLRDINVFSAPHDVHAEVHPPGRDFEKVPPGRIRGAGALWGEKMTTTLPDDILTPGKGQIRALINGGGNPATALPDPRKTMHAFRSLEVFVSLSARMDASARLADYVFAPKMQYERADIPMYIYDMSFYPEPWGQYTPEILPPPPGSDVIDDWYLLWGLAKRLGLGMQFRDQQISMDRPPTTDQLIELRCRGSVVPLDEIKRYPSGHIFDLEKYVQPARPGAKGRFDVMPSDVADVLAKVAAEKIPDRGAGAGAFTHLLQVRRIRESNNSTTVALHAVKQRMPYNWAALNPNDLQSLGLEEGSQVTISSDHGSVTAVLKADETVRTGALTMAHGWGGLSNDTSSYEDVGNNVNSLVSSEDHLEPINAMARMSAIPVSITPTQI